jgi:hypothetical protein
VVVGVRSGWLNGGWVERYISVCRTVRPFDGINEALRCEGEVLWKRHREGLFGVTGWELACAAPGANIHGNQLPM